MKSAAKIVTVYSYGFQYIPVVWISVPRRMGWEKVGVTLKSPEFPAPTRTKKVEAAAPDSCARGGGEDGEKVARKLRLLL